MHAESPLVSHGFLWPLRRARCQAKSIEFISSPDPCRDTAGARAEAGFERPGGKLDVLLSCYTLKRVADVSLHDTRAMLMHTVSVVYDATEMPLHRFGHLSITGSC